MLVSNLCLSRVWLVLDHQVGRLHQLAFVVYHVLMETRLAHIFLADKVDGLVKMDSVWLSSAQSLV